MVEPAEPDKDRITRMLREWSEGDREALDSILPIVYGELQRQAANCLRRERKNHTLQTTALIHEAYLKLINQRNIKWESRTHFFAIAARVMRQILVDYARMKRRGKRGGGAEDVRLSETVAAGREGAGVDLVALDEALTRLAEIDEQQARVVELRYFADLTLEETAEALHMSRATAAREWNTAKLWLRRELTR